MTINSLAVFVSTFGIILLILGVFIGLPALSYMVVKFGAAGYFRAKERENRKNKKYEKKIE